MTDDIARIAAGLTEAQKDALTPLSFFNDRTGAELVSLGLMHRPGGSWAHTMLGRQVHAHLQAMQETRREG